MASIALLLASACTGADDTVVFQADFFSKSWLSRPMVEPLAKTADGRDFAVVQELTLEYGDEGAAGLHNGWN